MSRRKVSVLNKWIITIGALLLLTACTNQEGVQEEVNEATVQEVAENESHGEHETDETSDTDSSDESEEEIEEPEEETGIEETENEEEQEPYVYITADRLTIRSDSHEDSESLGSLVKGKEVLVLEEVEQDESTWYKVQTLNPENSIEGWISAEYTVTDINELYSSPELFEDEELNEFFTSPTLFEENTVVAYYGHPHSEIMGIVGRHSVEELIPLLKETTETYHNASEEKGAVPAIYLVYGTVQPGGEINPMSYDLALSYIETAYQNGILIYLDHQIGKHSPQFAINELISFLRYPNVHLALDPEWRTDRPMQEVGHLTGEEINGIQDTMRAYMEERNIKGHRQFVFHQFIDSMIHNIEEVSVDDGPVIPVHNTSGWGSPDGKRATHDRNAGATNIPFKGFKLWYYYSDRPGVHYDNPLMTPDEVMDLNPQPGLVIYQ